MHLLLDGDILCYRAGFVANEPGQEDLACWQTGEMVKNIFTDSGADSYQIFLSGGENFRYKIYPEYKANRKDMARPIHLQAIRAFLVSELGAHITDGIEADDALGIAACQGKGSISSIDKDLDMIPGDHYHFVRKEWYTVTPQQGMEHFYWQLIMGDRADNIPGYDGKMRTTVPKFLQPYMEDLSILASVNNTEDMLMYVSDMWGCDDEERWNEFNQAAHCLWIQRKERDDWRNYLNDNIMEELGLPVGLIRSLPGPFDGHQEDGLPNMPA